MGILSRIRAFFGGKPKAPVIPPKRHPEIPIRAGHRGIAARKITPSQSDKKKIAKLEEDIAAAKTERTRLKQEGAPTPRGKIEQMWKESRRLLSMGGRYQGAERLQAQAAEAEKNNKRVIELEIAIPKWEAQLQKLKYPADVSPENLDKYRLLAGGEIEGFLYDQEPLFVHSSNVVLAQYFSKDKKLMLEFKDGHAYMYSNVSEAEAINFTVVGSKGGWTWDHLRIRGTKHGHRKPFVKIR